MNIKKGDNIKILTGKDRGKTGAVLRVFSEEEKVVVEGFNLYKKRVRPKKKGQKGETVMVSRPIHASNAMLVCPSCKEPSRTGYRVESGAKIRYCKKCNAPV